MNGDWGLLIINGFFKKLQSYFNYIYILVMEMQKSGDVIT